MAILPLLMVAGSAISLRVPVAQNTQPALPAPPAPRSYVPFPMPVTVSLPGAGGTASLTIGVAIDPQQAIDLQGQLATRDDLIPMLVTQTILTEATMHEPSALPARLPDALRTTFNAELVRLGMAEAVLEVFLLDWALIPSTAGKPSQSPEN